jgi:hypothetical protein
MRLKSVPFHGAIKDGRPYWSVLVFAEAYRFLVGREGYLVNAIQVALGVKISTFSGPEHLVIWPEARNFSRLDKQVLAKLDRVYHFLYLWAWVKEIGQMPSHREDFLAEFLMLEKEGKLGSLPEQPLRPNLPFLENSTKGLLCYSDTEANGQSAATNTKEDSRRTEISRKYRTRRLEWENTSESSISSSEYRKRSRQRRGRSRSHSESHRRRSSSRNKYRRRCEEDSERSRSRSPRRRSSSRNKHRRRHKSDSDRSRSRSPRRRSRSKDRYRRLLKEGSDRSRSRGRKLDVNPQKSVKEKGK